MTDLYLQSDGRDMTVWHDDDALLTEKEAGPVLWAHLKATLPTRDEPQDEPTDPAVRVRDKDGEVWVRTSADEATWFAAQRLARTWGNLLDRGPLEVVQPDAPSADERPFKVHDRVAVALDASSIEGLRGHIGVITAVPNYRPEVKVGHAGIFGWVHPDGLTLVGRA